METRQKKVFTDLSVIAHYWANQTQDEARNPHSNFYFEGNKIYSYGWHFEIARHFNENVILFTTDTYSSTTAKHINLVSRAIPYEKIVFNVPKFFESVNNYTAHKANLEHYLREIKDLVDKQQRARTNGEYYYNRVNSMYAEMKKYFEYFQEHYETKQVNNEYDVSEGKLSPMVAMTELAPELLKDGKLISVEDALEYLGVFVKEQSERTKQLLAEKRRQKKEDFDRLLPIWENDEDMSDADKYLWRELYNANKDRILFKTNFEKTVVETSKGIKLNTDTALTFLEWLVEYRKSGATETVRRPMGLEVYDINGTLWQVNELKPNGDFIAGCHKVAWKDIEGFATRQGWLKDGVVFKAELV